MKYLLDTHALIWLMSDQDSELPQQLIDSLLYYEDDFFISEISLVEIIQLQQIGRVVLNRPNTVRRAVNANGIKIIPISSDILETFYDLPIFSINGNRHTDPFDRIIISTAIKRGLTLVSRDGKFPAYTSKSGLSLMSI